MQVHFNGNSSTFGSAEGQVGQQGVVFRIGLLDDEELASASLLMRRHDEPTSALSPSAYLTTDLIDNNVSGIRWLTANWEGMRTVSQFELLLTSAVDVCVRIQIGRGASAWFVPPGPHAFDIADSSAPTILRGNFPDTVADRLMFEFLSRTSGQPVSVSLGPLPDSSQPVALSFSPHAHDVTVGLAGKRPFFKHAGEIAEDQPVVIPNLLDILATEGSDIDIELSSSVAGYIALEWEFTAHRVIRQFVDNQEHLTLDIPWNESQGTSIPLQPHGHPDSLMFTLTSSPASQRIALMPAMLSAASAALCRPIYECAQPVEITLARPLVGIDLWAAPLTPFVSAKLGVYLDDGGRPASTPITGLTGTLNIEHEHDTDCTLPSWWPVELDKPGVPHDELSAGRLWIQVSVEDGELLWFESNTTPPPELGPVHYRKHDGAWLVRQTPAFATGGAVCALMRLRVADNRPPPPPSVELRLVDIDGTEIRQSLAYVPGDDYSGTLRWDSAEPSAGNILIEHADIHVSSEVASKVKLSNLRLTYREPESQPE